jgi:hypothetical protein
MNEPDFPGAIKITLEVSEDGVLKIQTTTPDEGALIAALEFALFAVKAGVDSEQFLH